MVVYWRVKKYILGNILLLKCTEILSMLATELAENIKIHFFKSHFGGIYATDNLPKQLKNNTFIIVNTDVQSGPGKHWFTVLRRGTLLECFDSLGVSDVQSTFLSKSFNFKGLSNITFNTTQLQPSTSSLCGQYVLYFLFERFNNMDWDFDDLLNEVFSSNRDKNEMDVVKFMSNFGKNGD